MQEIGLASKATLIWGSSQIDWLHIFRAIDLLHERISELWSRPYGARFRQVLHLYHWRSAADRPFLEVLDMAAMCDTTDPKDQVFALLSHPSARLKKSYEARAELLVEADYTRSVEDVYTVFATRHIAVTNCLDVLSYVRSRLMGSVLLIKAPKAETFDLPSWVSDWNRRPDRHCLLTQHVTFASSGRGIFRHWHNYNVSSTKTAVNEDVRYSPKKALVLCASVIGNVIWHSTWNNGMFRVPPDKSEFQAIWRYLQGALLKRNPLSSTAGLIAKYRDALTCGGLHPRYSDAGGPQRHLTDFAAFWSQVWGNEPEAELVAKPDDPHPDDSDAFGLAFWYVWPGRMEFHTDTGYVGLGPKNMREGDEVCILQGGRVPCILRGVRDKTREEESQSFDQWELVGECYVSGAMHGELVEGDGIGEVQWEARTLV
jgi:hypothetical protein